MKYDVIIVGAGPGGSACAALLSKHGFKTVLMDKNDHVGEKHPQSQTLGTGRTFSPTCWHHWVA